MDNNFFDNHDESKAPKKTYVVISLVILVVIAIIIAVIFVTLTLKPEDGNNISSSAESLITSDEDESEQSQSISLDGSESQSESENSEVSFEMSETSEISEETSDLSVVPSEDNSSSEDTTELEHGFVINAYGYTYVYYGQGFEQFNGVKRHAENYAAALNKLKTALGDGINMYSMVVPTSVQFAEIPRDIYSADDFYNTSQKSYSAMVNAALNGITDIDAFSALADHAGEYLYFKTDKNWTALAAYYAYAKFASTVGSAPISLDAFPTGKIDVYLGAFYTATMSNKMKNSPDYIEYSLMDTVFPCNVTMYNKGLTYKNRSLIYTNLSSPISYGYYTFLGGTGERFEIVSTSVTNGKKILVLGDASAFPFVPYLAADYSEIYFCNIENYSGDIAQYAAEKGVSDVVVMSYATNTVRNDYLSKLSSLVTE